MKYLNRTKNMVLTLAADDLHIVKWFVDVAYAVHLDLKSHTGWVMSMGRGAVQSGLSKQKLVTRSTCESKLVGADDASTKIIWTKFFMEAQGYMIQENILYQDNKSTILLLNNGKASSGKRTQAINIRYFFLHDQQMNGNLSVKQCPTGEMIGDSMTKPKQSHYFKHFWSDVMGLE